MLKPAKPVNAVVGCDFLAVKPLAINAVNSATKPNNMKKIILLLALVVTVSLAHAQQAKKAPDQRAAHITKQLQKRLNLTADQANQVNAIYLTQATKMDSLKANRSPDKKLNHMTEKIILLTTHEHMMAVLNDTQKQQYTDWENSMKERKMAKKDTIGARP
jgi:hypothetical protein